MKLIVNADDYGYTKGITEGILYGHLQGIISSTTVLTNSLGLREAYEKSKTCPTLGFGVHLTLTLGKPLTKGKTICNQEGNFYGRKELVFENLDQEEVYQEWKAQIEKFIEVFERYPTHLDSHHSVHDHPLTLSITKRLCQEYHVQCRRHGQFKYVAGFYGPLATVENFIHLLVENKNEEAIEIMTHPGNSDAILRSISSYNDDRKKELAVLCSKEVKEYIMANNIELVTY